MSDVIYLRPIAPPASPEDVYEASQHSGGCFDLHRVEWAHSFLAADGGRMMCWYRAPDAESVRLALRQLGSDMDAVDSCSLIGDEDMDKPDVSGVNAIVEVSFDRPFPADNGGWLQRFKARLLEETGATFVLGFLSASCSRMVCLFQAGDTDSLHSALEALDLPADAVWRCTLVTPGAATP